MLDVGRTSPGPASPSLQATFAGRGIANFWYRRPRNPAFPLITHSARPLPCAHYSDALSAGVEEDEIGVIPGLNTTDPVVLS